MTLQTSEQTTKQVNNKKKNKKTPDSYKKQTRDSRKMCLTLFLKHHCKKKYNENKINE